ncbi:hypothetical protein ACTDI4_04245 [Mesorhizobium sp. PUT5]
MAEPVRLRQPIGRSVRVWSLGRCAKSIFAPFLVDRLAERHARGG